MTSSDALLAVLGGTPAFERKLHVGGPNIGDREGYYRRLDQVFDARWLTNNGAAAVEFEERVAKMLGVKHFFAMCNGTIALEIAIRACGLEGEAICPSFTFIATAHALEWQRINPVFADIDPATHLLDPAAVEAAITPETTGIVAVHTWGQPCNIAALSEIAKRHGLKLIFDAAHAFACSDGATPIGGFGDCEIFSFHATKFFNTGEGGGLSTNDGEIAMRVRLMRNFGFRGFDNVESVGTNGKMSELSAAFGLTNLESIDRFIEHNRRNFEAYRGALSTIPSLRMLPVDQGGRRNFQHVVVEVSDDSPLDRDELIEVLWAENVVARRYFYPGCDQMEPYSSRRSAPLPNTRRATERTILLPTGSSVTPECATRIVAIAREALANSREVRSALAKRPPQIPASMRAF